MQSKYPTQGEKVEGVARSMAFMRVRDDGRPLCIGHRGASAQFPENSVLSIEEAIKEGADAFEADLHLSADGQIIVMHDPTLDRTTDGKGQVHMVNWYGYMENLRSKREPRVPIARFQDILDVLARPENSTVWWLIDLKPNNQEKILEEMAKVLSSYPSGYDFSSQIVLGLWHPSWLSLAQRHLPQLAVAQIGFNTDHAREFFSSPRVRAYNMQFTSLLGEEGRRFVDEAHQAGKAVFAWTVNHEDCMSECVRIGLDAILTDRTGVCRKLLDRPDRGRGPADWYNWYRWIKYSFLGWFINLLGQRMLTRHGKLVKYE